MLFGLVPALAAVRTDLHESLKEGGRVAGGGTRSLFRNLLVVSEVALALVTLVGAGLLIQSFDRTRRVDPGFDADGVLLVGLGLSASGYGREQGLVFHHTLRERLEGLPGVEAVSLSEDVPLGFGGGSWEDVEVEGYVPRSDENMKIYRNLVAPGYFDLMRIPLLEGRDFALQDDREAAPVVIVNEAFHRRFLPGQNPLGKRLRGWGRWLTIVGVAKDSKYLSLREISLPYLYVPFDQFYNASMGAVFHIRTAGPPAALLPSVEGVVRALDPGVSIFAAAPMAEFIGASLFTVKMAASLLSALGALGLLLAAVGLYSVLAYSVEQRTHEIGVRLAVGAQPRDIFTLIARHGMLLTLVGIGFGLLGAIATTRLLGNLLYEVSATDPTTFIGIALFLAGVALLACYVPASRAARLDPMVALRYE